MKVHELFHRKKALPFPAIVGIFESLIYTANYFICGWIFYQLYKQKDNVSNKIWLLLFISVLKLFFLKKILINK